MPDMAEHPFETFRRSLAALTQYRPDVIRVPDFRRGPAFFSAAADLVITDPDAPLPP